MTIIINNDLIIDGKFTYRFIVITGTFSPNQTTSYPSTLLNAGTIKELSTDNCRFCFAICSQPGSGLYITGCSTDINGKMYLILSQAINAIISYMGIALIKNYL